MGLLFLSLTLIAISSLPKQLSSHGNGLFNTTRQLERSLYLTILGGFITKDYEHNYVILSSNLITGSSNVTSWLDEKVSKLDLNTLDNQKLI